MTPIPEEIQREITSGEKPLWCGRPRQGITFRGSDIFLIPFSFLWCGFAIFWESSVFQSPNAPAFFVLRGVPFVGVGIYMVIGRFFVEARQRQSTFYAVTSERILIVSGVFGRSVKSLSLKTLSDVSLSEKSSGAGSITFGPQPPFAAMFAGMSSWPGAEKQLGPRFDSIEEAKVVYELIRSAQRSA